MNQSLNIMVVDDSWITIKKLTLILENLGHTVIEKCRDGCEAVEKFSSVTPDLVTMDITMPETNGIDATKSILRDFPQAKIVIVTSHGQEQMVMEAINAGASGYILKPFRSDKLKEVIENVMA